MILTVNINFWNFVNIYPRKHLLCLKSEKWRLDSKLLNCDNAKLALHDNKTSSRSFIGSTLYDLTRFIGSTLYMNNRQHCERWLYALECYTDNALKCDSWLSTLGHINQQAYQIWEFKSSFSKGLYGYSPQYKSWLGTVGYIHEQAPESWLGALRWNRQKYESWLGAIR